MDAPRLYIANIGIITPLGLHSPAVTAAVNAGISAYSLSHFDNHAGEPITMASVPSPVFEHIQADIEEGDVYCAQYDRIIKMAIYAVQQTCAGLMPETAIPLILAMPEPEIHPSVDHGLLIRNLVQNVAPYIDLALTRTCHSGRAAGMEAIEFAFHYLHSTHNFMLMGGSDSYRNYTRLRNLDKSGRLLASGSDGGFATGEAACFLLLTPNPELAQIKDNHIIALHPPGIADESGHLYSEELYRGEGLDKAFKAALQHQPDHSIHNIYSSMNGEHYWAKEYGVAFLRNKTKFTDSVNIIHPADCYGDLGSATATTLIALAAENLHNSKSIHKHLVYSSSDTAKRGALVVEKIRIN